MPTATATREEARQRAREIVRNRHREPDGVIVAEPTDEEIEALRFIFNGQARVIDASS